MKSIAYIILISFVGLGVFGFTGLVDHHSTFSECVRAVIPGGDMPCDAGNAFAMNVYHAEAYLSFSLALLALAVAMGVAFFSIAIFGLAAEQSQKFPYLEPVYVPQAMAKIRDWRNLFQHSSPRLT